MVQGEPAIASEAKALFWALRTALIIISWPAVKRLFFSLSRKPATVIDESMTITAAAIMSSITVKPFGLKSEARNPKHETNSNFKCFNDLNRGFGFIIL